MAVDTQKQDFVSDLADIMRLLAQIEEKVPSLVNEHSDRGYGSGETVITLEDLGALGVKDAADVTSCINTAEQAYKLITAQVVTQEQDHMANVNKLKRVTK